MTMAFVVAMVSLKGGTGRTTLCANLASTLTQAGRRVLAVDLDPQNALGAHFGRGPMPEAGIAEGPLEPARTRGEAAAVPFGLPGDRLAAIEQTLRGDAGWLRRRLDAATPPGTELVLLDTPAYRSPWLQGALDVAHLALAVVTADPACYATVPALERLLAGTRHRGAACYLVNQFDAASPVRRDVLAAMHGALPGRVVPALVHADEAVRDALGRQRTLVRDGTASQAGNDLAEVGEWLVARLGAERPRAARKVG
jgi:cellulose synthase operon protein YhjQ